MGLINQPAFKHKYEAIGEASAAVTIAAIVTKFPAYAWINKGPTGKAVFLAAKLFWMCAASLGLVVGNVAAEKILVTIDQHGFDGSWESGQKLLAAVHAQGRELTDAEKKSIDEPIKDALRKFGRFGRVRKR